MKKRLDPDQIVDPRARSERIEDDRVLGGLYAQYEDSIVEGTVSTRTKSGTIVHEKLARFRLNWSPTGMRSHILMHESLPDSSA